VRVVLDSGGVTSLAGDRARLRALRDANLWPVIVPSAVLVECLTGDHRRDHAANRLLRTTTIVDADELVCRDAARLRTLTGQADTISAVDAIVAATAGAYRASAVVTSDPDDLAALAQVSGHPFTVSR
jgi:predicted nucleic acid-binding protein